MKKNKTKKKLQYFYGDCDALLGRCWNIISQLDMLTSCLPFHPMEIAILAINCLPFHQMKIAILAINCLPFHQMEIAILAINCLPFHKMEIAILANGED